MLGDLLDLFLVVIGDQRLVAVKFTQGFDRLDRIGINDFVPDEVLPLLGWQVLDQAVDRMEFLHAGNIEAAAKLIEGFDDCWVAVDLDGVVGLHPGEVLSEGRIVFS